MSRSWRGRDIMTGDAVEVVAEQGVITSIRPIKVDQQQLPWLSPGWFDLQVNGFGSYDLNKQEMTEEDIAGTTKALYKEGTALYLPTVITGAMDRMKQGLATIAAYRNCSEVNRAAIPGIHLEGPFISSEDGSRGAHPREHTCDPDWEKFEQLQAAADGLIRMVTLAPEREGAIPFIEKLVADNVIVAIGHTKATGEQITAAVEAGATVSTHLGNGSEPMLPRHPNYIWQQLAEDRLWATFVPDGHHLSPEVLKVMLRAKGKRSIFVSDTTQFGGMKPGVYRSLIGGEVRLTEAGRLHTLSNSNILAGSAMSFIDGFETVLHKTDMDMVELIEAMTSRPAQVMQMDDRIGKLQVGLQANLTIFQYEQTIDARPTIVETVVHGESVYKAENGV
ncbi:N-acetylglucosamine-6-phosphate deacetylase [Paenibacillus yanchengensis]|uniref:N-acetylglucosamine-6-phosphate deacetylase n=1 Tax=Paenibacillus yanchengensis TaxID=2035833 RepID=A0ABW4YII9_9BACL